MRAIDDLRAEARRCLGIVNLTVDDKVAAALLAYACELEQRARLVEAARKKRRERRPQ